MDTLHLLYWTAFAALVVFCFVSAISLLSISPTRSSRSAKPATAQQGRMLAKTDPDSKLSSNVTTTTNNAASTLYALVIGINKYPNLKHLNGAVPDADSFTEFLQADLGVPSSHIIDLRDASASRAGIIGAFQALRDNSQIKRGSPILIYFAGHGGVNPASEDWKQRYGVVSKIQVIFPYDYEMECAGGKVNCIPDKTIAGLLNQLAKAKGNNITVIFDSCHSASANRTAGERQARSATVKLAIPVDIDEDILRHTSIDSSFSSTDSSPGAARHTDLPLCAYQTSHIYFAACGSEEQAWEENGKGAFTAALLKKIRACGVDKITYQNLMSELPWLPGQTPHCYGANKSRILFDARVPSRKMAYFPVIYDPTRRTLTLEAGAASGVTEDSVWEVRTSAAEGDKHIVGRVKAGPPGVSIAALAPEKSEDGDLFWRRCEAGNQWREVKKKLYARLIESGPGNELKVWFSPEAKRLIFPALGDETTEEPVSKDREVGYVVHSERKTADIAVELYQPTGTGEGPHPGSAKGSNGPDTGSRVVFHLCNPEAEKYGIATLQRRKPARRADVETVLFAAARWHWHLKRTSPGPTRLETEMFKIAEKRLVNGEYLDDELNFVGEEGKVDLNRQGVVDIEVHEKDMYAVRLKSRMSMPLYVRMFYFDTATFAIVDLFEHSISNSRADAVIPANGEFIIGDTGEGDAPIHFRLKQGNALEVGYMKVFWSTDPLELHYLKQGSAFELEVGGQSRVVNRMKGWGRQWGSVCLKIVQRLPTK